MDIPETASLFITIDRTTEDSVGPHVAQLLNLQNAHPISIPEKDVQADSAEIEENACTDVFRHKKKSAKAKTKKSYTLVADFEARLSQVASSTTSKQDVSAGSLLRTEVVPTNFPSPVLTHIGRKKTIFTNIAAVAEALRREEAHLIAFLIWELGTNGKPDDKGKLVIKGIFQQRQVEKVIGRYREVYVTCKSCGVDDTVLTMEDEQLKMPKQPWSGSKFVVIVLADLAGKCNACGSESIVPRIRSGGCRGLTVGHRRTVQELRKQ
ncbi:translation initiation factor IF2/IF5 [Lophium mytilinum]|uniref:Translation initiation factor IF2/IF5 n=1 Tax=Lophium mytilinum TaxID=390894 RepID=A0A6A6QLD7_9PEZI|nr:translation initiation factor IF2/IF5 [Lophium mytilinum]